MKISKNNDVHKVNLKWIKESLEEYDEVHKTPMETCQTEIINGVKYHILDGPIEEYMKSKGAVNMNDIDWS